MRIASKCSRDFDCDWQRVNAFSHSVTPIRNLLSQIISYSDTKVPVLVVMEYKRANVIYVYELIFLLHTSRSTECRLTEYSCASFHHNLCSEVTQKQSFLHVCVLCVQLIARTWAHMNMDSKGSLLVIQSLNEKGKRATNDNYHDYYNETTVYPN